MNAFPTHTHLMDAQLSSAGRSHAADSAQADTRRKDRSVKNGVMKQSVGSAGCMSQNNDAQAWGACLYTYVSQFWMCLSGLRSDLLLYLNNSPG